MKAMSPTLLIKELVFNIQNTKQFENNWSGFFFLCSSYIRCHVDYSFLGDVFCSLLHNFVHQNISQNNQTVSILLEKRRVCLKLFRKFPRPLVNFFVIF